MAVLVKDSFNRTNSTTGLGQTETGQTWQTFGSVWGIQNNQAYPIDLDIFSFPYVASSKTNHISYQIKVSITGSYPVIIWKCVDLGNVFTLEPDGVYRISGGVSTKISNTSRFLVNNDIVRIEIRDAAHTIFLNGEQFVSFTDASNVDGNKFGFTAADTATRFDDLLIEDLSPTGTTHIKTLSETVSLSENITKRLSSFKTFSDSITTSDAVSKRLSVIVADSIATSENESEDTSRSFSDSLDFTDNQTQAANKAIADSVSFDESLSERIERNLSDLIPINDNISLSNSNTRSINLSDSVAILDSISKSLTRSIADNLDLSDKDDETVFKSLVDSVTLSDSLSTYGGKTILLTDSITVTDSIITTKQLNRFFAESISVSDNFAKQSARNIKLYDVILTDDSIVTFSPDAPELVGVIHLQGKRELYVYLQGKRDLTFNLQGKRELTINLKGGLNVISNQDFSMISGDTKTVVIELDEVADLTGASAKWGMKRKGSEVFTLFKETPVLRIVDKEIHIPFEKNDTEELSGKYIHECEITDQLGNVSTVTTGTVIITTGMIK